MKRMLLVLGVVLLPASPAAAVDRQAIDEAVDRGVAALKRLQRPDGTWQHVEIGATALAGLTLLECGVDKDDPAVKSAAKAIRDAGLNTMHTYSLSLAILFLDKLDFVSDTPLIESMIVRLLAGQYATGGWSYHCPTLAADEVRRIQAEMNPNRLLRSGRDLSELPAKGKRGVKDLPKEVQAQLNAVARVGGIVRPAGQHGSDNSNTQFATLALWVGRRYGVPTQQALLKVDHHFRTSQNPDGGWGYTTLPGVIEMSTAPMTCAGVLGLACGNGAKFDLKKAKSDKPGKVDISKDASLTSGLAVLATAVGKPLGWAGNGNRPAAIPPVTGRGYYFLWSLERVCVTLNLETLAKKDWYNWGAEVLLANQKPAGTWEGEYADSGADTCFALLFLKKVNLARDLSSSIGGLKDAGKVLRAGGVGGDGLKEEPDKPLKPAGIGSEKDEGGSSPSRPSTGAETVRRPATDTPRPGTQTKPAERTPGTPSNRLGDELVRSRGQERANLLEKLRESKGVQYTEALLAAIPRLDADGRREARYALAKRFTRMTETTLRNYLKDEDVEVRRAAALASAARGSRVLVPDLIRLLSDSEATVQKAAHAALVDMTGKDFGPKAEANAAQRKAAIAAWLRWWKENSRE